MHNNNEVSVGAGAAQQRPGSRAAQRLRGSSSTAWLAVSSRSLIFPAVVIQPLRPSSTPCPLAPASPWKTCKFGREGVCLVLVTEGAPGRAFPPVLGTLVLALCSARAPQRQASGNDIVGRVCVYVYMYVRVCASVPVSPGHY